ncbi:hypothetical protein QTP88_003629 [Uroleucon formosanum]
MKASVVTQYNVLMVLQMWCKGNSDEVVKANRRKLKKICVETLKQKEEAVFCSVRTVEKISVPNCKGDSIAHEMCALQFWDFHFTARKVLPNSSMAPAKMRRHLESVHGELKEKNVEFFIRKRDELLKSINCMVQTTKTVNEKATEASYLVSYQIAQRGEAYTIAESLIKPCAMEMVKCMLDEKSAKEISKIPLSNDTVANRINDLAADIQNELIFRLKSCKFALQMDESTDVAGLAILIVIVRYQHESTLLEDLLLCKSLPSRTTGAEIFDLLNSFLEGNEIPWENCVDICTDGAIHECKPL